VSNSTSLWTDLLFGIAKHWIAGESYEAGIARAQESNTNKILGILNLLGEETTVQDEVAAATNEYIDVLKTIAARKVESCISIKPTQLGLTIDRKLYEENMKSILGTAKSLGSFVWIDMEGSRYTDNTVESYLEFRKSFDNVGVAIQSYLKRSEEDVNRILDSNGTIRLVKGAYNEDPSIAFKRKEEINGNFLKLMRVMFERGRGFAVATHHEKLIEAAAELSKARSSNFEYEMLMGIRDPKKLELAQRGFRVSEYIPYGKGWWPYSVRRIREHKSNILLLGRSLLSG
jgi:proline dehydrogenase